MRGDYEFYKCGAKFEFQFTPLREGRLPEGSGFLLPKMFQFTPLREGRPPFTVLSRAPKEFQFTPLREGRLDYFYKIPIDLTVSIHAPA